MCKLSNPTSMTSVSNCTCLFITFPCIISFSFAFPIYVLTVLLSPSRGTIFLVRVIYCICVRIYVSANHATYDVTLDVLRIHTCISPTVILYPGTPYLRALLPTFDPKSMSLFAFQTLLCIPTYSWIYFLDRGPDIHQFTHTTATPASVPFIT